MKRTYEAPAIQCHQKLVDVTGSFGSGSGSTDGGSKFWKEGKEWYKEGKDGW
jgi:hypothetical protein